MLKYLVGMMMMAACALVANAEVIDSYVTPAGDGANGKDRWGYSTWYTAGYSSTANPNWAGHWYESGDGQNRDVYLQVALPGVDPASVESAMLYINVVGCTGNGASLYHCDSTAATGDAGQQLSGGTMVVDLTPAAAPLGWLAIDVTGAVTGDLTAGCTHAAFHFADKGYSGLSFASGDDAVNAPFLRLTTVPEPTAAVMLLAMTAGCIIRRSRQ